MGESLAAGSTEGTKEKAGKTPVTLNKQTTSTPRHCQAGSFTVVDFPHPHTTTSCRLSISCVSQMDSSNFPAISDAALQA